MKVNFRTSDFRRRVADAGALMLKNRYFEQNPFLEDDPQSLVARPGMRRLCYIGDGPIRGLKSEPGSFDGDLFVASGANLFRMDNQLNQTSIYGALNSPLKGFVNMAITGNIGDTPAYCFVADGRNLFVYIENGYALGSYSGSPANGDTVNMDGTYYRFTNGSVDAGSPDGTSAKPWLVNVGLLPIEAWRNFVNAVNNKGANGTDYTTDIVAHPTITGTGYTSTIATVRARIAGAVGNSLPTTVTSGAIVATTPTLTGGGAPTFSKVQMPEDIGVIDVAVINSFVIVVPAQTDGYIGRFYWIEPGETSVDETNFATAERSPDGIYGVQVFGDQFWLPGQSTTEVWYVTGDQSAPMRRLQGVVFDRGSWENTALAIHEQMVVVDADGGVFVIKGGAPQRVSTPDIEEQIREAMSKQNSYLV